MRLPSPSFLLGAGVEALLIWALDMHTSVIVVAGITLIISAAVIAVYQSEAT